MRNIDDPTVPDEIPDMPIEGPEAEKAMEEKAKGTNPNTVKAEKIIYLRKTGQYQAISGLVVLDTGPRGER